MMRRIFLSFAAIIAFALPLAAQSDQQTQLGIEATIQSQLDAFKQDDFAEAFTFASPMIKQMFGSHERFGAMVRQGYPMVWRPADVQFLELRDIDGRLWQKVMIRDETGGFHMLDYQMVQSAEGWQINGVQILRAPDVGA